MGKGSKNKQKKTSNNLPQSSLQQFFVLDVINQSLKVHVNFILRIQGARELEGGSDTKEEQNRQKEKSA